MPFRSKNETYSVRDELPGREVNQGRELLFPDISYERGGGGNNREGELFEGELIVEVQ